MHKYIMIGLVVSTFCVSPGLAEPPPSEPLFWTWKNPLGEAADNNNIIRMVYVNCSNRTGAQAAAEAEAFIKKYTPRKICILLKGFGAGHGDKDDTLPALFRHWCDALPDDDNPAMNPPDGLEGECEQETEDFGIPNWWGTPWMSKGVEECSKWMTEFIKKYPKTTSYAPQRFHFDVEGRIRADSNLWLKAFAACKGELDHPQDPRWKSEPIYGFDGKTMEWLWNVARNHGVHFRASQGWKADVNHDCVNWYEGLCRQACDGAMKAACYDRIHAGWPFSPVKCSNYETSLRIKAPHKYIQRGLLGAQDWCELRWEGFGDLQAPMLYPVNWAHIGEDDSSHEEAVSGGPGTAAGEEGAHGANHNWTGADLWRATMRVHRANVDALIASLQDGHKPSEITPWIMNVGEKLNVRRVTSCNEKTDPAGIECLDTENGAVWRYEITQDNMREMLTMLRGRRITEYLVWNGDDDVVQEDWNQLDTAIKQVWMYEAKTEGVGYVDGKFPEMTMSVVYPDGPWMATFNADFGKKLIMDPLQPGERTSIEAPPEIRTDTTYTTTDQGATTTLTVQVHQPYAKPDDGPPSDSPESMDVTVEAWLHPDSHSWKAELTVSLFNHEKKDWEPLGESQLTIGGTRTHVFSEPTNASRFVKNGLVRVQVECECDDPFTPMFDCVQVVETDPAID